MDHRWRPIVDESALNSIAGSRLGSEVGGRGPPTRGGLTSHGSSAVPLPTSHYRTRLYRVRTALRTTARVLVGGVSTETTVLYCLLYETKLVRDRKQDCSVN